MEKKLIKIKIPGANELINDKVLVKKLKQGKKASMVFVYVYQRLIVERKKNVTIPEMINLDWFVEFNRDEIYKIMEVFVSLEIIAKKIINSRNVTYLMTDYGREVFIEKIQIAIDKAGVEVE